MARRHLEQADVALLIVDASLGVTAGDANIAGYAEESGRSVIIVMNKWDLALEAAAEKAARELEHQGVKPHVAESRVRTRKHTSVVRKKAVTGRVDPAQLVEDYEKIVRTRFKFLDYAPIVFVSAKTGERTEKLFDLIDRRADARRRRISTGELNRWVAEVDLDRGTSPAARRVKIYYVTQAGTSPPTFILFTNQSKRLHFSYERFLENLLRKSFDFTRDADSIPAAAEGKARERGARGRSDEDCELTRVDVLEASVEQATACLFFGCRIVPNPTN